MKNYTTLILAGLVVVLAAVLIGVMVYIQNQPAEERAIQPLVEIAAMEPDSAKWGINYPNQYDSLMKT
ncbi:MAG: ammonia-forming cytochrome c nitrite reductase subunit c552, partial [Chloroflexota bacterium]